MQDSKYGKPGDVDPEVLSMFEMQQYFLLTDERENFVPKRILVSLNSEDYEIEEKLTEFLSSTNEEYLVNKTGGIEKSIQYEHCTKSISSKIYDSLELEEQGSSTDPNSGVFNPYLGGFEFLSLNEEELRYVVHLEKRIERQHVISTPWTYVEVIKNNYTETSQWCRWVGLATNTFRCEYHNYHFLTSTINENYIFHRTGRTVRSRIRHMPYKNEGFSFFDSFLDHYVMAQTALTLLLVIPYFVYFLMYDKESKNLKLQKLMGLKVANYVFVHFVYFLVFFVFYFLIIYVFGRFVFKFRMYTQISPGLLWVVFLSVAVFAISVSFFASIFFQSTFLALFVSYFVGITFPTLMCNIIETSPKGSILYKPLLVLYPWSICDAITQMFLPVSNSNVVLGFDHLFKDADLLLAVIFNFLNSVCYLLLYFVFHDGFQATGFRRVLKLLCICKKKKIFLQNNDHLTDDDVLEEKRIVERIMKEQIEEESLADNAIILNGIKKEYGSSGFLGKIFGKPSKLALKPLFLRVKENQCFSVLGENGAGKTTAIKCFTNQVACSSGEAFIFGVDSKSTSINRMIGICLQQNVHYGELSIYDHLKYFACLRGVPLSKQKEEILNILQETGLQQLVSTNHNSFWNRHLKPVSSLKETPKRLLSIAIIGGSKIIILDEPTSNLDPISRRAIWKLILTKKKSRTIILTSHSLLEAEILSDRILILKGGEAKCIGEKSHLRNKFGEGWMMKLKYRQGISGETIVELVKSKMEEDPIVKSDIHNELTLSLKANGEEIADICEMFEKREMGQWSIKQVNLEEVFINVVQDQDEEEMGEEDLTAIRKEFKGEKDDIIEKRKSVTFFVQIIAVLKRSFLLNKRNWISSLIQIFFPLLLILMVVLMKSSNSAVEKGIVDMEINKIGNDFICEDGMLFVYTTQGDSFADLVMDTLIQNEGWNENSFASFSNETLLRSWIFDNPNKTMTAIIFDESPTNFTYYEILINSTSSKKPNNDIRVRSKEWQLLIENAILEIETGGRTRIIVEEKAFGKIELKNRPFVFNFLELIGQIIFSEGCLFCVIFTLFYRTKDKENRTTLLLRVFGMNEFPIQFGVFATAFVFCLLNATSTWIFSVLFEVEVLSKSFFLIPIAVLTLYFFAILSQAIFLSNLIDRTATVMLFGIAFGSFLYYTGYLMDPGLMESFFNYDTGFFGTVVLFVVIPVLFPHFSFAKIFADMYNKNVPIFNFQSKEYDQNVGYSFVDFFKNTENEIMGYSSSPSFLFLILLLVSAMFYSFLSFLFFLVRLRAWRVFKTDSPSASDESVAVSLRKVNSKPLKGIDLEVKRGNIHSIVGIKNIVEVAATAKYSSGEVMVAGHLRSSKIRKEVAFLPEKSILIDEGMRAIELCSLVAATKGVKFSKIKEECVGKLTLLGLSEVVNNTQKISTFSGGMKRKLAVCLSLIGNPSILLFSEPTVGIDVFSKWHIWRTILFLCKEKDRTCIIETTSDLETLGIADVVSFYNNDGVMVEEGNPMKMSTQYVRGYVVEITTKSGFEKEHVEKFLQSLKLSYTFTQIHNNYHCVTIECSKEKIPVLFRKLEENAKENGFVEHYGINFASSYFDLYTGVLTNKKKVDKSKEIPSSEKVVTIESEEVFEEELIEIQLSDDKPIMKILDGTWNSNGTTEDVGINLFSDRIESKGGRVSVSLKDVEQIKKRNEISFCFNNPNSDGVVKISMLNNSNAASFEEKLCELVENTVLNT